MPVPRKVRNAEYDARNALMMEQCLTCKHYLTCIHRCRFTDIETLCIYLIENEELPGKLPRRCWMCLRRNGKCEFECWKYERSLLEKRPLGREPKDVRGGRGVGGRPVAPEDREPVPFIDTEVYNVHIPPNLELDAP